MPLIRPQDLPLYTWTGTALPAGVECRKGEVPGTGRVVIIFLNVHTNQYTGVVEDFDQTLLPEVLARIGILQVSSPVALH